MRCLIVGTVCVSTLLASGTGRAEKTAAGSHGMAPLVRLLAESDDVDLQADVLRGMYEALRGRRQVPQPEGWPAVARKLAAGPSAEVRQKALILSVLFGDAQALAQLRKTAGNPVASPGARRSALQILVEVRAPELLPLLRDLIADRNMRGPALRGLAAMNDRAVPEVILRTYPSFSDAEKADAVTSLASRPEYALALLAAMEQGRVPRSDLSAFTARQLIGFKDKRLTEKLTAVWGSIRPTSQDKATLLTRYKNLVPPGALRKADRSHGRLVFTRTCATCHTLFNEGGKIGPDLTGAQRSNPDYILSKVLDPNAVVARDYQVSVITTIEGRTLTGLIKSETDKTVTVQTVNEVFTLPKADIEDRQRSTLSMMPEGLLAPMSDIEVRDLIAYLAGNEQVKLPGEKP
jgi:putative heme-binding domain-containing protein